MEIIGKHFCQLLKNRIHQSLFYGIMADETTDNATKQQLIIYIKFFDIDAEGVLFPCVEYLDLVCPLSGKAEDIMVSIFLQ